MLNITKEEMLKKQIDPILAELVILNRNKQLKVKPGFDGEYGQVLLPENLTIKKEKTSKQKTLF